MFEKYVQKSSKISKKVENALCPINKVWQCSMPEKKKAAHRGL